MVIFKVYTTCKTGWVYEVEANSKEEAEEKFNESNFLSAYEDMGWQGESEEEVERVERVDDEEVIFEDD